MCRNDLHLHGKAVCIHSLTEGCHVLPGWWAALDVWPHQQPPPLCTQVYPNSRALVVSTENITQNWYFGNNRAMLIPNCLFRVGGAAMLLSNRRSDRRRSKCEARGLCVHMMHWACVF